MSISIETAKKTIAALLAAKKYTTLRDMMATMNAFDIAAIFDAMDMESIPLLFRLLPKDLAAECFVEMDPDQQEILVRGFSDHELKAVLSELYMDDTVDLIEEMPANVVGRILNQVDSQTRTTINSLLKYPEDSAGSIMTTEYVSLSKSMTAEEAIAHIRKSGIEKETINTCYITSGLDRQLIGVVSIRQIIIADPKTTIADFLEDHVISVSTHTDQEEVAQIFSKYNLTAAPVVDNEGRLVGIVTVDDVLDILQEETTEDIEKMAAIVPQDKSYLKQTTFEIFKSRIPWLLLLMISATFTGMIITGFEDALSKFVILTAYIPMLMDTGGNSGSQASVTIIRGISLNELAFNDIFRVLWKEIRVAVLCGGTLALCNFAKLMIFDRLSLLVALTICATLMVTICCAKLVGCTLPLFASKLGFDPAVMASPFITTIVDAISLLVYFNIAQTLLGI